MAPLLTKKDTNNIKLQLLLNKEGNRVLEEHLRKLSFTVDEPEAFYEDLKPYKEEFEKLKKKKIFKEDQFDILFPTDRKTYIGKLDITLKFHIIRQFYEKEKHYTDINFWKGEYDEKCYEDNLLQIIHLFQIRNTWAHTKPGDDFECNKSKLCQLLLDLGGTKKNQDNYLTLPFYKLILEVNGVWSEVPTIQAAFTGRKKEIKEIHAKLTSNYNSHGTVLTGLGGVGKTQTAIHFCEKYFAEFDKNVIWINCGSNIENSFLKAAEKMDILTKDKLGLKQEFETILTKVYSCVSVKKSLFVFDNAKNFTEIKNVLPKGISPESEKPKVLITSQFTEWGLNFDTVEIKVFEDEDAVEYFTKTGVVKEEETEEKRQDLLSLSKELGYLPIALQLAASYIKRRKGFNVNTYLREWKHKRKSIMDEEMTSTIEMTVLTSWRLALERLLESDTKIAIGLINLIAYMDGKQIDRKLFLHLDTEDLKGNQIELDNDGDHNDDDDDDDDDDAEDMIGDALLSLAEYSLINLDEQKITIHSLVQYVIRMRPKLLRQHLSKQIIYVFKFIDLISRTINGVNSVSKNDLKEHEIWIPHVGQFFQIMEETKMDCTINEMIEEMVRNLLFINCALMKLRKYDIAYHGFKILENKFGTFNNDNEYVQLMATHNKACCLMQQRRFDDALDVFDKGLEKIRRFGTEEGTDLPLNTTAFTTYLNNKACCLTDLGQYGKALDFFGQVIAELHRVGLQDKGLYVTVLNNKGLCLLRKGDLLEGLRSIENASSEIDKTSVETSITSSFKSSFKLSEQGKYQYLMHTFYWLDSTEEEPVVLFKLSTANNLAHALMEQSRFKEASDTLTNAVYEPADNNESVELSQLFELRRHNLALCLMEQGEYNEALREFQIIEANQTYLDDDDKTRLTTTHNVGYCLQRLGRYKEAKQKFEHIVQCSSSVSGENHLLASSKVNLANCLLCLNENEEAYKTFGEVEQNLKRTLQYPHVHTLRVQYYMARCLLNQNRIDVALKSFKEIAKLQKESLTERHHNYLQTQHYVGACHLEQGDIKEALAILTETERIQTDVIGGKHPDVLISRQTIARCYIETNMLDRALEMLKNLKKEQILRLNETHPSVLETDNYIKQCLDKKHCQSLSV